MARFVRGDDVLELWLEPAPPEAPYNRLQLATRESRAGVAGPIEVRSDWPARDYVELQLARYGAGWTRVVDPRREAYVIDDPSAAGFEAALRADPSDVGAALVYSDWLQEQAHPRGVLIAIQHARAQHDDAELAEREDDLFYDHDEILRGPLARYDDEKLALVWERGFIRRARIDGRSSDGEGEQILWELLRHPSARFLRELEIGCHRAGDQDNQLICAVLTTADHAPPLRVLRIGDFDEAAYDNIDISRAPIGDLSLMSLQYPHLEDVMLKGRGDVVLGDLELLHARRFAIKTSSMYPATIAAVARAPWPRLDELELWFGNGEYGGDCTIDDVAPLFDRARFPALSKLRLMNTMLSDEACDPLAASTLAPHIVELDFALGSLSRIGARVLARQRSAFPSLRVLNVFACSLSTDAMQLLRDASYHVVERPPSRHFDGNHSWTRQKPSRYISDSE